MGSKGTLIPSPSITRVHPDGWKMRVFTLLDEPESSLFAMGYALVVALLIVVYLVVLWAGSVQVLHVSSDYGWYIETVLVAFFTLDYVARLLTTPRKRKFIFNLLNTMDLLSLLPYYIELAHYDVKHLDVLRSLRVVRLLRLFPILKYASRRSTMMRVFITALRKAGDGIGFLVISLFVVSSFFATVIYYVETAYCELRNDVWIYRDGPLMGRATYFQSIPLSLWWCIVTLTTVGYGDMYPLTDGGKLVASLVMLCSIILMAFPTTILGGAYAEAFQEYKRHKSALNGELHRGDSMESLTSDSFIQYCKPPLQGSYSVENALAQPPSDTTMARRSTISGMPSSWTNQKALELRRVNNELALYREKLSSLLATINDLEKQQAQLTSDLVAHSTDEF